MTYDVSQLRRTEFPWADAEQTIYLNHASTGPLPQRSVAVAQKWAELRTMPHRISEELEFGTLARGRELAAQLINATPGEIAIAVNTSFGINLAAFALPLEAGDIVLTPDLEFPANVYPWMQLAAKRGVIYRRIPCVNGVVDEERLRRELEDPAVKAVSVSWVGFASGYMVDLVTIGRACRASGTYFIVDAIQGLGGRALDVRAAQIDILACGAQKWLLGPWGGGFVYVRDELVSQLEPHDVSWMAVRDSDDFSRLVNYDLTWRDDARKFEFITLPYQDIACMNASLELLHELGLDAIEQHITTLTDEIVAWAASQPNVELVTPSSPRHRAGIVAVRPPDAVNASARLKAAKVAHSLREGSIRLAPHCYNTIEEIRRALEIIA
jgi:cysteine desulfurase / selenocysteine lyase